MVTAKRGLGQTALVTGASIGTGLDLAECFAEDGYNLILVAGSEAALHRGSTRLSLEHGVENGSTCRATCAGTGRPNESEAADMHESCSPMREFSDCVR